MSLWDSSTVSSLDATDELKVFRKQFFIPKKMDVGGKGEEEAVYMNGNSLGLLCQESEDIVLGELNKWKSVGVLGHGCGTLPWLTLEDHVNQSTAELLNCGVDEVTNMNSSVPTLFG